MNQRADKSRPVHYRNGTSVSGSRTSLDRNPGQDPPTGRRSSRLVVSIFFKSDGGKPLEMREPTYLYSAAGPQSRDLNS
jgi:hypothetical protein